MCGGSWLEGFFKDGLEEVAVVARHHHKLEIPVIRTDEHAGKIAARPEFIARRVGAADGCKGCDFVTHSSRFRNSAFARPHRHLPVHQHRQQPVSELGEFLVFRSAVDNLAQ